MIKNKTILAIITARGGSKEIPGKNIKELAGKPLIAWTVEAGKRSRYLDRIIVSTDSKEIADVARRYGAEVPFLRPAELSGDLAHQEDAILHAMNYMEGQSQKYDWVAILTPTHPLRSESEIDAVCEEMKRLKDVGGILSVVKCNSHPLFANRLPEDKSLGDFVPEELKLKNRQELPVYYQISGSTALYDWSFFKEASA